MFACLVNSRAEGEDGAFWTTTAADEAEAISESGIEEGLRGLGDADVLSLSRRDLAWVSMRPEMSGFRERGV